jgi:hypothetical protein
MESISSNNNERKRRNYFTNDASFDIQIPSSLRDLHGTAFSIKQLERLETIDDARNITLG